VRAAAIGLVVVVVALALLWPCFSAQPSGAPSAARPAASAPKTPAAPAFNWNCFRGPQHGLWPAGDTPLEWDGKSGAGILWKAPLKIGGVSSPVIWDKRVFITEADGDERALLAFDADTGKQLWRQLVPDGGKGEPLLSTTDAGLALPTPVCDADGIYAMFGSGDLAAFTLDGKPKWQIFLKRPIIGYGFSSSPCLFDKHVCVQLDDHTGGHLYAVQTADGKIDWDIERSRGASWSSPMVLPGSPGVNGSNGKPVMAVNANGSITGYDTEGKAVWDLDAATGEVTPSPAWWKGRIYPVHTGSRLFCYDVTTHPDNPEKLWDHTGLLCDVSSPVVVNGLLFMAKGSGDLICVDANTGKEVWKHRCPGCYSSLIGSGDRIYCLGRDGTMLIFAAEREYRVIATSKLGEGSDATPALSSGRIYIRARKNLWCIGN
jgi:outer membrane protein assembly factor BamB